MNNNLVPRYAFLIKGTGRHADRLQAFDKALLHAGPLAHNLVTVSSILPADCKIINPEEGFKLLTPGQITFCVMAKQDSNKKGEIASASVGMICSKDPNQYGYISEFHATDKTEDEAKHIAERLAKEMYMAKLNINEKMLIKTEILNVTAAIEVEQDNEWVSAVAICIFVI